MASARHDERGRVEREKVREREKARERQRETDRQTDRQTDREAEREIGVCGGGVMPSWKDQMSRFGTMLPSRVSMRRECGVGLDIRQPSRLDQIDGFQTSDLP